MPKAVTELTQGQAFTRSSEEGGISDSAQRVFKVILSAPSEQFSPQAACGVYIGSIHPSNPNIVCFDFNARFDGESRMVALVTFNYKNFNSNAASNNREEQRTKSPEIRLATWTSDTSLYETPCLGWRYWLSSANDNDPYVPPKNPAGDTYEGVTELQPVTTFRVEQMTVSDPMANIAYVGYINNKLVQLGSLNCNPHTLMLKGVSATPHQESFNAYLWKGYKVVYELAYRRNLVAMPADFNDRNGAQVQVEIGWDRLQVLEGQRVYNSGLNTAGVDSRALALKHVNFQVYSPLAYADNSQNTWVRAMVSIPSMDGGGWVQRPASSPIAMNSDGTPRDLTSQFAGKYLSPILLRYQTQLDADLQSVLSLRLT